MERARVALQRPAPLVRPPALSIVYAVLFALALVAVVASLGLGAADLSDVTLRPALLRLRVQRFLSAFLAGAALAVGGVLVQGLFRNPLASPSVIGTSAGASLGGRVALLVGQLFVGTTGARWLAPEMWVPVGCIAGALGALALLMAVTRVRDDLVVLLLTGFLLSSTFISLEGFVTSLAQDRWELSRALLSFALGDVSGTGPRQIALAAPLVLVGCAVAWTWSGSLDLMLTGEDEARSLGVEAAELRRWIVIWTAVLTAAAVTIGGSVGFVGLVVPHALRPFVGVLHHRLVPAAALGGGAYLALCDVVCRVLPGRSEIPLGVVTGLLGAPTFLWLLLKQRRQSYSL